MKYLILTLALFATACCTPTNRCDIEGLQAALGSDDSEYDLDHDGTVTQADHAIMLRLCQE